jgi:hypothetical protein
VFTPVYYERQEADAVSERVSRQTKPPLRPGSETEWWGERKGRVVTCAALAGSRPLIEWILVHSSASSKESGGRMVTIRFASIVFPEPGGPTSSTFGSERLRLLVIQLHKVRHLGERAQWPDPASSSYPRPALSQMLPRRARSIPNLCPDHTASCWPRQPLHRSPGGLRRKRQPGTSPCLAARSPPLFLPTPPTSLQALVVCRALAMPL